jgi:hypothetical protein
MWLAEQAIPAPGFSWIALLSMCVALGVSAAVYVALVRRSTAGRAWIETEEWASATGLRARRHPGEADDALRPFVERGAQVLASLSSNDLTIAQLQTPGPAAAGEARPIRWHVLIRRLASGDPAAGWPASGLRPTAASASLLDLFGLVSFPLMGPTQRFTVYGTDSRWARRLHKSHARALAPADIGVLLVGNRLVLDFSARPFDPITFGRMTALADQLAIHLPPTG